MTNNNEISFQIFDAPLADGKMVAVFSSSDQSLFHVMTLKDAEKVAAQLNALCKEIEMMGFRKND